MLPPNDTTERVSQSSQNIWDILVEIAQNGALVDVRTRLGNYPNMLITKLNAPITRQQGESIRFEMELQEVFIQDRKSIRETYIDNNLLEEDLGEVTVSDRHLRNINRFVQNTVQRVVRESEDDVGTVIGFSTSSQKRLTTIESTTPDGSKVPLDDIFGEARVQLAYKTRLFAEYTNDEEALKLLKGEANLSGLIDETKYQIWRAFTIGMKEGEIYTLPAGSDNPYFTVRPKIPDGTSDEFRQNNRFRTIEIITHNDGLATDIAGEFRQGAIQIDASTFEDAIRAGQRIDIDPIQRRCAIRKSVHRKRYRTLSFP